MTLRHIARTLTIGLALSGLAVSAYAQAQQTAPPPQAKPFEPVSGQAGKDVVWVPTPTELVEKMLDMAKVTPQDFVIDLGSGDGRNIIAAARRGARALGVEFNPDMVELSRRAAREAGVADKATFVEGDMYEADISKATVMALFLLPTNLEKLKDKFLDLPPGTRIVMNTFTVEGWEPDETETVEGTCVSWCKSLLHIVPAKVAGTWKLASGELVLAQDFQFVTGTLSTGGVVTQISNGRLKGRDLSFKAGDVEYTGRVDGDRIAGVTARPGAAGNRQNWTATRGSN